MRRLSILLCRPCASPRRHRRSRPRTSIRASRSRSWCRSGRAAPPTSSSASSASRCGRFSASRWWSRTSRAPSASLPSRRWRVRGPTATRCRSAIPAPMCSRPIIYKKKFKIDYDKEVIMVTRLGEVPLVLAATTKDFAPKTYAEFIAYAKANPGKVRYASVGIGSNNHYDMEAFAKWAGIELVHIPNKGGGAAITNDLVTGDAHVALRQCRKLRGRDQGRAAAGPGGHGRCSACPNIRTCRRSRSSAMPPARDCGRLSMRRPPRRATCSRPCTRRPCSRSIPSRCRPPSRSR